SLFTHLTQSLPNQRLSLSSILFINKLCPVFFFQAEDGIRDSSVTGVQTCALPISSEDIAETFSAMSSEGMRPGLSATYRSGTLRSEERRVGKECRSPRSPYH